jgi:hypothetical protein
MKVVGDLMVFQQKAEEITVREAMTRIESAREQDRESALKLMALRMASQKYLWGLAQKNGWTRFVDESQHKVLFPGTSSQHWIDYACNGMDFFSQRVEPLWKRGMARMSEQEKVSFVEWTTEWKQNLEELHRVWAQRIESAWSERAHGILEKLLQEYESENKLTNSTQNARREFYRAQEDAAAATGQLATFESDNEFVQTRRLIEMRDACMNEKHALEQQWKEEWGLIAPIFEILSNEATTVQEMELSHVQMLTNYVKNPVHARARDPHAAVLKRLIELTLHEVEKNEWPLPTAQMQEYDRRLRKALQEKFFERMFWKSNELEVESQQLQKELQGKESYRQWVSLRSMAIQAKQEEEKWSKLWREGEAQTALQRKRVQQAAEELNTIIATRAHWRVVV